MLLQRQLRCNGARLKVHTTRKEKKKEKGNYVEFMTECLYHKKTAK